MNFSIQICPKKDLELKTEKTNVGTKLNIVETLCVPIFSQTGQHWLFWSKFCQKIDLGSEIQKTNVWIRISIVDMPCVVIFRKNAKLWPFQPKFVQKWILGSEIQKSKSGFRIYTSKMPLCQFSVRRENFDFFGLNLPKKEIRIWNSQN